VRACVLPDGLRLSPVRELLVVYRIDVLKR
jgi:hypothetical protein